MTLTAAIKFTQGSNTDSPGRAVFGTMTDGPVVCSDGGIGATTRVWTMFDVPPGSAIPTGTFSTSSTGTFPQPDAVGGYLVLLTASDGIDTVSVMLDFQIVELSGRMIPPFKASDLALTFGGQTRGYSPTMEAWLRYVDGLKTVHNTRAATTAVLAAHTFAGNVMTATANGALPSQDGVALVVGDRLLVKDEGSGTSLQNGIYTVTALGSGGTPWVLTRSSDFNTNFSVTAGYFGVIEEGTINGKRGFTLTTANPIVLNTTTLTFRTFAFSALTPPASQDGFLARALGSDLQYFGGTNGQAAVWSGGQATFGSVSLASGSAGISGVLAVANGGTGLSAVGAANTVLVSNGTTLAYSLIGDANVAGGASIAVTKLALGAANRVLLSDGTNNQFAQITDSFIATGAALAVTKLALGSANTVLQSNGTVNSFAQVSNAHVAAGAAVAVTKLALGSANTVLLSDGTTNQFAQVTNVHVSASAGIVLSKLGQSGATTGQFSIWNGSAWAPGMAAQFGTTFYVDPLFTGTSNGSQISPYTSITAAIAAAPSTGALINMAPFSNTTENPVLPATGLWEIRCEETNRATITGNVTCTSVVQCQYSLTNMVVTGNVTGDATSSSGNFLILTNTQILGNCNLTRTSSGAWFLLGRGAGSTIFSLGGSVQGTTTVAGAILANRFTFGGAVSFTSPACEFFGSRFSVAGISLGSGSATFTNCLFAVIPTFTGPGTVDVDGFTHSKIPGFTLAAGATLTLRSAVDPSGITQGGAATTNVLAWNGTVWAPAAAGAALTASAPADVTFSAAVVGVGTTAARADHKHNITVATTVSVGTANAQGSATTLALSDHTHAVTGLAIASQAQGDILFFNGTSWVRLAAGTSGLVLRTQGAAANPIWSTVAVSALSPGATGQALITTGGVPAWGNDFAAQDLTTTGSLLGLLAVQFGSTQATPSIKQANTVVPAAVGQSLTVQAQTSAGGGASVGGKLVLASGAGTTSGAIEMKVGGGTLVFDHGTTAAGTTTIGSTIFTLNLNSISPLGINAGGGIYQFKAAELALSTNVQLLSFSNTSGPTIKPLDNSTTGWVGGLFTVQGQNSTGTGATVGGKVLVASGTGATDGDLELMQGATSVLKFTPTTATVGASGRTLTVNSANGALFKIAGATQLTLSGSGTVKLASGGLLSTDDNTVNASTGALWTVRGQNSTGTGATVGGKLLLSSGSGATFGDVEVNAASGSVVLTSTVQVKVGSPLLSFTDTTATIALQNIATNSVTGGLLTMHGQDCSGTATNGGDVLVRPGTGTALNGNIALIATPANYGTMRRGVFFGAADAGPSGNPANGAFMWASAAGELVARGVSGDMKLGDGTLSAIVNCNGGFGTGFTVQNNGALLMNVNPSGLFVSPTHITFDVSAGFSDKVINVADTNPAALAGTLQKLTVQAQGGVGLTGTVVTGTLELAGGDTTGGTGTRLGGPTLIRGGHAPTANGNVAFGTLPGTGWQNMADGIFIGNSTAAPTGAPSGGGFLRVVAGALIYVGSSGTPTTLAVA